MRGAQHSEDEATLTSSQGSAVPGESEERMIDRYKLLEKIGEGGCGVVYVAEQTEPVRRRVAVKIIKPGMDTRQVLARFEAERQALALMDHPNIAKVLDAGETENGHPFFVMELVRGIPITEYCDRNHLSTSQRLGLFVQVCGAIQHAHQKGIIHRDIKPSNILATLHDGVPLPKVIDFGIAKATAGQLLTEKTLYTAFEQFIGTPAYMSPEQAEMTGSDIDTRSDIYSLGVLLYELLVGKTPFDAGELIRSGIEQMRRTIREKEPQRPSERLTNMPGEEQTTTARCRSSESPRLVSILRGDLDWIAMKCLEKDRTRRYETAASLAQDIQRFLSHEPVTARPPSRLYRLQKLVLRNKVVFGAGSAVAMALVAGFTVSLALYLRESEAHRLAHLAEFKATAAASRSEQVALFLKEMLRGVGPSVALGHNTDMLRQILDTASERVGKDLKQQPEVQAELYTVMARTYSDLGQHDRALELHREALRIRRAVFGDHHRLVAESLSRVGAELRVKGNYAEAEEVLRRAVALNHELGQTQDENTAFALDALAVVRALRGDQTEALRLQKQAVDTCRRLGPGNELQLADMLNDLAGILMNDGKGDLVAAEQPYLEALTIRRRLSGNLHPQTVLPLHNLGRLYRLRGELDKAEPALKEALASLRTVVGENHPRTAITVHEYALVLGAKGDTAAADRMLRQALQVYHANFGQEHDFIAEALHDLGVNLCRQQRYAEAVTNLTQAVDMRRRLIGPRSAVVGESLCALAKALTYQKDVAAAEQLLQESLTIAHESSLHSPVQLALNLADIAEVFAQQRNWTRAESLLMEAYNGLDAVSPRDELRSRQIILRMVAFYSGWAESSPALGLTEKIAEWKRKLGELAGPG